MKQLTKQRIQKPLLSVVPMLIVFAIPIIVVMVITIIGMSIYGEDYEMSDLGTRILMEVAMLIASIYVISLVKKKHRTHFREVIHVKNFDFMLVIMFTIFAWSLGELCDHLSGLILSNFMTIEPNAPLELTAVNVISAVILAPIFEEIIFRYGACEIPRGAYSVPIICIANALYFSACHGYNVQGFLNVFIGGIITAYIFIKTRNILYTMLEHALHNAICCIDFAEIIGEYHTYKNGFLLYNWIWLAINAVLLAVSVVYFVKVFRKKYTENYYEINYETGLAKINGGLKNE